MVGLTALVLAVDELVTSVLLPDEMFIMLGVVGVVGVWAAAAGVNIPVFGLPCIATMLAMLIC